MGTNYYLKPRPACEYCGSPAEEQGLHIGKSSIGWCFSLHVYPESAHPIHDLDDWIPLFEKHGVVDEYGGEIPAADMLTEITERSHPNGLNRHRVEAGRCLGPGAGTWDRMIGEFS